jgi:hypothetical protein
MSSNHPAGPPMTLGNMRRLGAHRFIASCLNDACRHQGLIDVSKYPDDVECQSFHSRAVCAKCGARGRHIDVRSNWKEQPTHESLTGKVWRRFIFESADLKKTMAAAGVVDKPTIYFVEQA